MNTFKLKEISKKRLLVVMFLLESCTFGLLAVMGYEFYLAQKVSDAKKYMAQIQPENIIKIERPELHYFYGLIANEVIQDKPEWLQETAIYNHNADGLNDRFNYKETKDPQTFRVITLGDSFTYGHFISTQNNWTELLEDKLNEIDKKLCGAQKIEVINLGAPGYDARYIFERYKLVGQKYNPDLVIWFEAGSGISRYNEWALPLIDECQKKYEAGDKTINRKDAYLSCWKLATEKIVKERSNQELATYVTSSYADFFAETKGIPTRIAGFKWLSAADQKLLSDLAGQSEQHIFVPMIPGLKKSDKLADGHPSKAGHRMISSAVFDYVSSESDTICSRFKEFQSLEPTISP